MYQNEINLLQIPESVIKETEEFRTKLATLVEEESSEAEIKAYRVPMGIYEHRKKGDYMARVRITAGLVTPAQLKKIAVLSHKYGDGIVHITTRQDIQIHRVAFNNLANVLEQLLEVGLSTRGGGGNTVRNVTSCPMTGICPNQKFDVSAYSIAVTEYMLQNNDSFNLPRKYKITFSGCQNDCAFASVADLGFFAHIRDGVKGFAVYGAGGMGLNPSIAIKLEDFVLDTEVFEISQAIKEIFDEYGDRKNRHKARLRYVLKRLGEQEFIRIYRKKRLEIKQRANRSYPAIREISRTESTGNNTANTSKLPENVLRQNTDGLFSVKVNLKLGNIPWKDLIIVAEIADKYSLDLPRTTQSQDILLTSIPAQDIQSAVEDTRQLGIDITGREKANIVTCTGADTCQLGLCLSKGLADAISKQLETLDVPKKTIRISGCPNSCGQHHIAEIGFQGRAKKIDGKMMPCYDLFVGGRVYEGQTAFGKSIATLAAKDVPHFLYEIFKQEAFDTKLFDEILQKYSNFSRDFTNDYFYDYGVSHLFSLKGRGSGECASGIMDIIKSDIDQAEKYLQDANKINSDSLYQAVVFAAKSLLVLFGYKPQSDREIFGLFKENIIEAGYINKDTEDIFDKVIAYKTTEVDSLTNEIENIEELIEKVKQLFFSLDSSLKFRTDLIEKTSSPKPVKEKKDCMVDLRGVVCPLNFVKAKLELEKIQIGESLSILLDEGEPIQNVPDSFASQGQEILKKDKKDGYYLVEVKRKK